MIDLILSDWARQFATTALASTAACSAVMVVSWPYLVRDALDVRMRRVAREREQLRLRQRARLEGENPISLIRKRPHKLLARLVELLGLTDKPADGKTSQMLSHAGYRGNSAVITYMAARIIMPLAMFAMAMFYIFIVLQPAQPLLIKLMMAIAAGGLGYFLPTIYVKNQVTKRRQSIERAWPDVLDLLLICVESGMSIDPALQKVALEIGPQSPHLAEELSLTSAELSFLPDRRHAFENLADRTGLESVKAVIVSFKQAEKHGTSLGRSLRVLAQENRTLRLSMAEKKAASLPPKLTVPMILFFLPVLFVVILVPAGIQMSM
jgi:tight adherence protein C